MAKKSRSKPKPQEKPAIESEDQQIDDLQPKQQKFSLYLLLEVDRSATQDQIKKQYRKLALQYHPDKKRDDPDAKEKFLKFKQAYDILSDPEKRKIYDQTGVFGSQEQFDQKGFQSAYDYFRSMYKKVTKQDIQNFQKQYRYGEMQREDLIQYYNNHQGNMVQLIESIPLSQNSDIPRFIQFFEEQIKNKNIQRFKNFDKTKNKVKLLKDQTEQFQAMKKQESQGLKNLALAIRQKQAHHQKDFIAALEQKYGGGAKKKKAEYKKQEKNPSKNKGKTSKDK